MKEKDMELIQIGQQPSTPTLTVKQMFRQLADREAEFTHNTRERILVSSQTSRLG
jgi:hypothetical protein